MSGHTRFVAVLFIFLIAGYLPAAFVAQQVEDPASSTTDATCASGQEADGSCKANLYSETDDKTKNESETAATDNKKQTAVTESDASSCKDNHEKCAFWAEYGECKNNPNYMLTNCRKSCKKCLNQE